MIFFCHLNDVSSFLRIFPQINPLTTGHQTFHIVHPNEEFPQKAMISRLKKNHVYFALAESCRIHVYVVQYVIYMVRCDVQCWNMQKQIDATRYIVPYKTDDRMSIIVLRYARRRMRIVSQGRLTL